MGQMGHVLGMGHMPWVLTHQYFDSLIISLIREIIRLVISGHFTDCFEDCQVRVIYVFRYSVIATTIKFSCLNLIKLETHDCVIIIL